MIRPRRSIARPVALVLLVALLGTACSDGGSGDGSEDRGQEAPRTTTTRPSTTTAPPPSVGPTGAAYVDALAAALASGASGGLPLDAEEARCLAPRWVDTLGEDRLVAGGVTPEELASGYGADTSQALDDILDEAAAKAMVAAFAACQVDVEKVFIDALTAGRDLTAEQRACLAEAFPDGMVEKALVLGLSEGEAAVEENIELNDMLTAAARKCVSTPSG